MIQYPNNVQATMGYPYNPVLFLKLLLLVNKALNDKAPLYF